jgi:hypothetical protein
MKGMNMDTIKKILPRRPSHKAKIAAIAVAGMLGAFFSVSDAQAFNCVRGVYRAGCVSAYGAVGVSPNRAVAMGRYGNVYGSPRLLLLLAQRPADLPLTAPQPPTIE